MTEMMEYDDDEYCEDSQQVKVGFSFFQSEGLLSDQEPGLLSLNGKSILERMHSVIVKVHFRLASYDHSFRRKYSEPVWIRAPLFEPGLFGPCQHVVQSGLKPFITEQAEQIDHVSCDHQEQTV